MSIPSYKDFLLTLLPLKVQQHPNIRVCASNIRVCAMTAALCHAVFELPKSLILRAPFFNFNTPLRYKTSAQSSLSWEMLTSGTFKALAPWWWTAEHWSKCVVLISDTCPQSLTVRARGLTVRAVKLRSSVQKSHYPWSGTKSILPLAHCRRNSSVSSHVSDTVSVYCYDH